MERMIETGGFPPLVVADDEKGIAGRICCLVLFNLAKQLDDLLDDGYSTRVLEQCHGNLPPLFALMHFHMEQLKQGRKVAVVCSGDKKQVLGWLEKLEDGMIFYTYREGFDDPQLHRMQTPYAILQ